MTSRRERWVRDWARAPWHCWIKAEPGWLDLLAELWSRLPDSAVEELLARGRALIVLPPANGGRVVRITQALPSGAHVLQLDPALLARHRSEALAILAHELAHVCARGGDDALLNDLAADRLACQWGFGEGLLRALQQDLEESHPRILAAASLAISRQAN